MGLVILSVGLVLVVVGLVWFFKSKQTLMLKWEKWENARLKKVSRVFGQGLFYDILSRNLMHFIIRIYIH